jgi:hypothetical protein
MRELAKAFFSLDIVHPFQYYSSGKDQVFQEHLITQEIGKL